MDKKITLLPTCDINCMYSPETNKYYVAIYNKQLTTIESYTELDYVINNKNKYYTKNDFIIEK